MKQWYFHFIYLFIIAYLGYNYWSGVQAFKAFEQFNTQLKADSEAINDLASRTLRTIQKHCDAYKYSYNVRQCNNAVIAHFKGKKETIGTKTLKAEALIRNPFTGATTTSVGSFEYQVLPKCSRDCQ